MHVHKVLNPNAPPQVTSTACAFGVMTKVPEPGKVKTRLSPPLTPEEAAEINSCFLRDICESLAEACQQTNARGVGIYTPSGAESAYQDILPPGFFLLPQRGNAFGDRLVFAAQDLFSAGFSAVCLINSDSPTVPGASFSEAARELATPGERIVLGPSDDGGYYLIGLKHLRRRLFEEIDWSTDRVLAQTIERANEQGVPVHQLPSGYDVDDDGTLQRLCSELLGSPGSSVEVAPNTSKFLKSIIEREGRARIWPM